MKKIAIILMIMLLGSFILFNNSNQTVSAAPNNLQSGWQKLNDAFEDDGFMYYRDLPVYEAYMMWDTTVSNGKYDYNIFTDYVTSPEGTILEYYNFEKGKYEAVGLFEYIYLEGVTYRNKAQFQLIKDITNNEYGRFNIYRSGYADETPLQPDDHYKLYWDTDYREKSYELEGNGNNKYIFRYKPIIDVEEPNPDDEYTTVDQLPRTTINEPITKVTFWIDGFKLKLGFNYNNNNYFMNYTFNNNQDMDMFKTKEAYFMNIDSPEIFINLDSDRLYLRDIITVQDAEKNTFVPHVIWSMKDDTIKQYLSYKAHTYIQQNNKGVHMAYVYIDEFVIDKMLSATVRWNSYRENKFPDNLIHGSTSHWQYHSKTLVNGDHLEYRDKTRNWATYLTGWGIISAAIRWNVTQTIPEIQEVDFGNLSKDYNITKSEVNGHMMQVSKGFGGINNNPRYKLWALALQEGMNDNAFGSRTKIYQNYDNLDDPKNLKIMEIVYETDGQIYRTSGNEIDTELSGPSDEFGDGTSTKTEFERIGLLQIIVLIDVVLIVLVFVMPLIQKGKLLKTKELVAAIITILLLSLVLYFGIQFGISGKIVTFILRL